MRKPIHYSYRKTLYLLLCAVSALLLHGNLAFAEETTSPLTPQPDPKTLIRAAMDHWRGVTSYSEMTMTIHRADWQREMSMRGWTEGDELSLVRVTAPAKDKGNATLIDDNNMWMFAPKINRVIKVPSSMMGQSWMGSDFSNKDISKNTDIIEQYTHNLLECREEGGHQIYTIESIPHEEAAVVWGKEILQIRDDYVLLKQQYIDQDGTLVKEMEALEIQTIDERSVATIMRMTQIDDPEHWTQVHTTHIDFDVKLPDGLFTLSNLRNPRQ